MREMVTKILDSIFFQRNLIRICLASQFARSSECERLEATSCCSMTVSLVHEGLLDRQENERICSDGALPVRWADNFRLISLAHRTSRKKKLP